MMSQVRRALLRGGNQRSWSCSRSWSWSWSWSWSRFSSLFTDSSSPGLVLQSRSTDVHQNLALEDWIDANVDLQGRGVLLLWRNRPCVVIGRHQNPWAECDLRVMRTAGVALARRRSGGGTVYHDLGNLNLTFFTSKKNYDRRRNLKVLTDALRNLRPGLDVRDTERLDIVLDGRYKISGTASRLSRQSSYHHCTLLHSADRSALSAVLRPSCPGIHSNATPSVPSPVANLIDHAPSLKWEELLEGVAQQYNREFRSGSPTVLVDPSDESAFPGVGRLEAELRGWDWTFGKTPKFSVATPLQLQEVLGSVELQVKEGRISGCTFHVPPDWVPQQLLKELENVLVGEKFCQNAAAAAAAALLRSQNRPIRELCAAVLQVMG